MNIWKDVYFKNKGIGRTPASAQPDQNLISQELHPSERIHSADASFEDTDSWNGRIRAEERVYDNGFQPAAPQPVKARFKPKLSTDKLSVPYPAILSQLHYQLSYIWSNILLEAKRNVEVLLVCGAAPKEGNTFISFHLAMFLSKENNWKILYVDTNPNHAVFQKMRDLPGLYSYVSGKKELGSMIVQTEYPGLYLLPSGTEAARINGNSMLSIETIKTLNDFCRNNFDVTIIDGQAVINNPVTVEIAKTADMTALVCRYGYSRREVSKSAIDRLQKYGVASLGVILNDRRYPVPQKFYQILG